MYRRFFRSLWGPLWADLRARGGRRGLWSSQNLGGPAASYLFLSPKGKDRIGWLVGDSRGPDPCVKSAAGPWIPLEGGLCTRLLGYSTTLLRGSASPK
jgi:hypothetical protein